MNEQEFHKSIFKLSHQVQMLNSELYIQEQREQLSNEILSSQISFIVLDTKKDHEIVVQELAAAINVRISLLQDADSNGSSRWQNLGKK